MSSAMRQPAVTENVERLLQTLYNETCANLHVQEPDSRPFDEIAQKAGLAVVGAADTNTAMVAIMFKDAEKFGMVERVKDTNGPLRYRITRLGERYMLRLEFDRMETSWRNRVERLEREHARDRDEFADAIEREREHGKALVEDAVAHWRTRLEDAERPWWKKLWRWLTAADVVERQNHPY